MKRIRLMPEFGEMRFTTRVKVWWYWVKLKIWAWRWGPKIRKALEEMNEKNANDQIV